MRALKLWFWAVRPWAYPASIIPVLLGTILAFADGFFYPLLFLLTLAGGLLIHTATNLFNDYFDFIYGVDTPGSRGSGWVLVEGLLSPRQVLRGAVVSLLALLPVGVYLFVLRGAVLLLLVIVGIFAGYFYTARPVALKYRGMGVPVVFFLMGPMMVLGAYFVQAARFSRGVFLVSLPIGFLVAAILYANEYRDIEQDSSQGIVNPSILLGRRKGRFIYYFLLAGAYIQVVTLVAAGLLGLEAMLIFLTLPFVIKPVRAVELSARGEKVPLFYSVDRLTAGLHLRFGLLLICGIALHCLW